MNNDSSLETTSNSPAFYLVFMQWQQILYSCFIGNSPQQHIQQVFKARQFHAVIKQLLFSSIGNLATSATLCVFFYSAETKSLLLLCTSFLWLIGLVNIVLWWRFKKQNPNKPIKQLITNLLILNLSVAAILHVTMMCYLFNQCDEQYRILLISTIIAFNCIGSWMFSSLPIAGLIWVFIFGFGCMIGLPADFLGNQVLTISLILLWVLILSATVLVSSRIFLNALEAEAKIENQHHVVGMLLHDFENNASDWLWETDEHGLLQHSSVHLAEILNITKAQLEGRNLSKIIYALCKTNNAQLLFKQFDIKLNSLQPFQDFHLPVQINNEDKWWSMTGKPLIDSNGLFHGWRGVVSDITQKKNAEQELEYYANYDSLTHLANRYCFNRYLNTIFQNQEQPSCTLFLIDLDNFKMINDSFGHFKGDLLLKEVSQRLTLLASQNQLVARLGGDEFAIVHKGELKHEHADQLAQSILQVLSKPWLIEESKIEVHASIGVASSVKDTNNETDLLKFADMALYSAKTQGKANACFFDTKLEEAARSKLDLLTNMKKGLANNEFVLYYQPQVDLKTQQLTGFEALVRWQHPTKGFIAPDLFIPLAEQSGFIDSLGEFILKQACKDAACWPKHLFVSINVSALQFNSDIITTIKETVENNNLSPNQVEIELTESVMISNINHVISTLHKIRQLGVRIALDDFGTGYSSLSYLQDIPLDKLKIDRSFVLKLDTEDNRQAIEIVKSITLLAQALNLTTTVEGIENNEHLPLFNDLNCTYGQGFYYAKPLSLAETKDFIKQRVAP